MRNLLENNLENQAIVEQLSPQETVPHPVLEEIGLKTELRDGQVNIKRWSVEKKCAWRKFWGKI